MPLLPLRRLWPVALLTVASVHGAAAQALPGSPGIGDPLDPKAAVPPAIHESVFRTYRASGEVILRSWPDTNAEAGRIGGWRAYAREASAGDGSTPRAASSAATPAAAASAAGQPMPAAAGHLPR